MDPIKVIITDDQPIVRAGLVALLHVHKDIQVLYEANDGLEAVQAVRDFKPDVVVMDISMPNLNGVDATAEILSFAPETKIVALSIHSGKHFVKDMLAKGARGYLLKDTAPEELVRAIRQVYSGNIFLDSAITALALSKDKDTSDEENINILQTKLHRPPVTRDILVRSRIVSQLEGNIDKPFSLISAPAGYGKSMAASIWLQQSSRLFTWLSLDQEHNDLRVFLLYLQAAIKKLFPGAFAQTGKMLLATELPPIKVISYAVINDLDEIEQDFILVLDDYHLIKEKRIHVLINELLKYPPEHMHLSILTRIDPPLKINFLSANGRMTELRMNDLSFTDLEINDLFMGLHGENLEHEITQSIHERTEGWIVGLRMAFMSVKTMEDVQRILSNLKGDNRTFQDYLLQEVIFTQDEVAQELMLKTAILDRFSADLIESFAFESGSATIQYSGEEFVQWLIQSNLFIIELDDQKRWFRYHHLIRDLLRKNLKRKKTPAEISRYHALASRWFEQQGFIEESIQYMLTSGDIAEAGNIVERHRWAKLDDDQWYVVQKWIEMLPPELRQQRPNVLLSGCWPLYETFQLTEIPPFLEHVKTMLSDQPGDQELWGELFFFYGAILYWSGEGKSSLEFFNKAQKLIPENRMLLMGLLTLLSGLSRSMTGQGEEAIRLLKKQVKEMESTGGVFISRLRGGLFFITFFLSRLAQARIESQQAQIVARKSGIDYSDAWNYYMEACTDLHSGQLDDALRNFSGAVDQRYILHTRGATDAVGGLALTQQLLGQKEAAEGSLNLMMEFARELGDPIYTSVALSSRARIDLLKGDLASALEWEKTVNEAISSASLFMWLEVPVFTQVRVLISSGTPECLDKAGKLLEEIIDVASSVFYMNHVIEALILKAMLLLKQNHKKEAKRVLEEGLTLAEAGGWIRPFLEGAGDLVPLLVEIKAENSFVSFIDLTLKHIQAFISRNQLKEGSHPVKEDLPSPGSESENKIDLLSIREKEIIRMMAQGLRNKEIASALFVAEGTVKKHVYNICQKWDVHNRISMLAIARENGLIEG
ncbi:MAG: response regulator [Bacteroides sp.]|nr:response regulator [Bacteroides sp.]